MGLSHLEPIGTPFHPGVIMFLSCLILIFHNFVARIVGIPVPPHSDTNLYLNSSNIGVRSGENPTCAGHVPVNGQPGRWGGRLGGLDLLIWLKQIPVKWWEQLWWTSVNLWLPSNWRQWKDSTITSHNFHLILSSSLEIHQHKLSAENPSPLGTLQIWMPTRGRGCR